MTTIQAYVSTLRNAQERIAAQLGVNLPYTDHDQRVAQVATLAIIAVLVKTLTDAGIITDAQLQAEWQAAVAAVWPAEPPATPPPL